MKRKNRIEKKPSNVSQDNGQTHDGASEATSLLRQTKPLFSIIKHYPPPWMEEQRRMKKLKSSLSREKLKGSVSSLEGTQTPSSLEEHNGTIEDTQAPFEPQSTNCSE